MGEAPVVGGGDGVGEALRDVHVQVELTVLAEVRRLGAEADLGHVVAVGDGERGVVRGHGDRGRPGRAAGTVHSGDGDDDLVRRRGVPPGGEGGAGGTDRTDEGRAEQRRSGGAGGQGAKGHGRFLPLARRLLAAHPLVRDHRRA